jgi:hypothetical protein
MSSTLSNQKKKKKEKKEKQKGKDAILQEDTGRIMI